MAASGSPDFAFYEQLLALHNEMLEASHKLDWESVAELEQRCATLMSQRPPTPPGSDAQAREKTLLLEILAKRQEVMSEINAWQEDVRPMLRAFGTLPR